MNFIVLAAICGILLMMMNSIESLLQPNDPSYCKDQRQLCRDRVAEHINCNNSQKLACASPNKLPKGPYNGIEYVLTPDNIKNIVDQHNSIRDKIASGHVRPFPPAARMVAMTWDAELADMARLNILSCKVGLDKCHDTERYRYSGQNIGLERFSLPITEPMIFINQTIERWVNTFKYLPNNLVDKFEDMPGQSPPYEFGLFTTMIADRNSRVGCAALKYKIFANGRDSEDVYFVCNYAADNMIGIPTYKRSANPGSGCVAGLDSVYSFLCKSSEPFDVNNPFELYPF